MVEEDSHLKLLPPFIFDIYNVFEHIDRHILAALHSYQPSLAQMLVFWVTYVESKCCHFITV